MNNTEYQDILGISSHWLIAMLQSPAACWRNASTRSSQPRSQTEYHSGKRTLSSLSGVGAPRPHSRGNLP